MLLFVRVFFSTAGENKLEHSGFFNLDLTDFGSSWPCSLSLPTGGWCLQLITFSSLQCRLLFLPGMVFIATHQNPLGCRDTLENADPQATP